MNGLTPDRFGEYFQALHQREPYSWQRRLARGALKADWPVAIDLPTGSGKTACIDIAVFALACQAARPVSERTAPRRIFFCVNRRVIVDEAYDRSVKIAKALQGVEGQGGILAEIAAALRQLAGTSAKSDIPPLDVLELRGGIYRDNRWARSATQPTIICSTIDQLGSRLLFRGYGVSPSAASIQAALIAYDSLILLDEAHISEPFRQTLQSVRRYLDPDKWAEQVIGIRPAIFVPMTATPPDTVAQDDVIRLDKKDRQNDSLNQRLICGKRARLRQVADVAAAAVEEAERFSKDSPSSVGIIVNRVATAKAVYGQLREGHPSAVVDLVIGSIRPIDRDAQAERLRPLVGPDRPKISEKTSYIVATQCLEVGADYDFDALVTECASLDALRQRFGRLNRAGRPIEVKAVILIDDKDMKPDDKLDDDDPLDPIYGNALTRTWNWLSAHAQVEASAGAEEAVPGRRRRRAAAALSQVRLIDFGIDAFNTVLAQHGTNGKIPKELLAPSASLNAPVILPAYIDFWCQTAPQPVPDPGVSLFIHGRQRGEPDVQVCWRADLIGDDKDWCDVVALLPPTAAECMSVPISRVRRWLRQQDVSDADHGDILGVPEANNEEERPSKRIGVLWRGPKESDLTKSSDLRAGDTLVLPVPAQGWNDLGHIPVSAAAATATSEPAAAESPSIDVAEVAWARARDKAVLRLHPALRQRFPDLPVFAQLFGRLADEDDPPSATELRQLLRVSYQSMAHGELGQTLGNLASRQPRMEWYPDKRGVVLTTRKRLGSHAWFIPLDEGDDEPSRIERERPVTLVDHTQHVVEAVQSALALLPMNELAAAFTLGAQLHDLGKADERFQAMLRRSDRTDAWLLAGTTSALLAKSDRLPQTRSDRRAARIRAELPEGFRHEMLSIPLAERTVELADRAAHRDLVLHLIAAHHGYARPFAPVVFDEDPPDVEVNGIQLSAADRCANPPHRLDSGIAERFWSLTRRFGWWGLAYLEAILRLADQQASAEEDAGEHEGAAEEVLEEAT